MSLTQVFSEVTDRGTDAAALPEPLLKKTPETEIVEALRKVHILSGLSDDEYLWLATHGSERLAPSGTTLFREGEPVREMSLLLRGEIHVRRERGGPSSLFVGRAGQISGLIPFSRMKNYGGLGYAVGEVWALQFDQQLFPAMLAAIPSMAQRCVSTLLDRVREVTRMEQQSEKLNALGKLAANLAHELNNPASAAQRAASGLLDELRVYGQRKYEMGTLCLDRAKMEPVRAWQLRLRERAAESVEELDTALHAEREDSLLAWLEKHGVMEPWQIAPDLTEMGVSPADLDELASLMVEPGAGPGASSMGVVLAQFASSVRAERMTEAMLDSTARIFDLIRAIKDYSYMDQAPIQELDVPQGLDNTLTMLQSRLDQVEVVRRYAPDLPPISGFGSELNQVWMALLENALDAIEESGRRDGIITVSAQISGDLLLIEVWDNGRGIPLENRDRVFEPFFTTKAPGKGLGLGLDTVQRIVRKHRGYVSVQSEPGATCFQVRLPIEQVQAY